MELGPLEVIVSWQALLLAVIVYAVVHSFQAALILTAGEDKVQQRWVKHVAMPILPLILGAIGALVFPFYPAMIVQFAAKSASPHAVYMVWGAVIGQFSDYLNSRIAGIMKFKNGENTETELLPTARTISTVMKRFDPPSK